MKRSRSKNLLWLKLKSMMNNLKMMCGDTVKGRRTKIARKKLKSRIENT